LAHCFYILICYIKYIYNFLSDYAIMISIFL